MKHDMLEYSDVDVSALTYKDITIRFTVGRSITIKKTRNPNGTWHSETKYIMGYKTNIGEILDSEYHKIALEMIQKNNDEALLQAVNSYVGEHIYWFKNESEQFEYAIECTVSGSYKYWEGFKCPESCKPGQIDIYQLLEAEEKEADDDIEI